jgi:hypothetical protein
MPRYYFDIRRDGVIEQDPEGRQLPDFTAARAEAVVAAVVLVADADPAEIPDFQIEVRDESGKVLFGVQRPPFGSSVASPATIKLRHYPEPRQPLTLAGLFCCSNLRLADALPLRKIKRLS